MAAGVGVGVKPKRRRDPGSRRGQRKIAIAIFSAIGGGLALLLAWPWARAVFDGAVPGRAIDAGADGDALLDDLPESLSRDEVRDTLGALAPIISACGRAGPEGDEVRVHLTIAGRTGTVTEATVAKQYSGTPVAECAVGVVERAQFPRFRKKVLTVAYPFKLLPAPAPADAGADDSG